MKLERVGSRQIVLTTASCSFSHSRYSSAAVNGRGCLRGRPVASLPDIIGLRCGAMCGLLTEAGTGGGGICCEARLEAAAEETLEACVGCERFCRGEGGSELTSGAIVVAQEALTASHRPLICGRRCLLRLRLGANWTFTVTRRWMGRTLRKIEGGVVRTPLF